MGYKDPAAVVECWEQLHEAVLELATRCATPRQRLLAIAEKQLLTVAELGTAFRDEELKEWIARLARRLSGTFNHPSRIAAFKTINEMSDQDVDAMLIEVVAIYDEVTRYELMERLRGVAA